jgi:uncharacterized protein
MKFHRKRVRRPNPWSSTEIPPFDTNFLGENTVFPEYRDLITQLKTTDSHFHNLFEKHNELDQRIKNMESGIEPATHLAIEALKKEKLALKDELYQILRKASA